MREHRGRVVVIKVGGAAMERTPLSRSFAEDVSLCSTPGSTR
jgi:acetylglutamate kinase